MKPKKPSSVMSSQLKALLGDPEQSNTIMELILLISTAPDAAARRERTIAIQGFAEILLRKDGKRN